MILMESTQLQGRHNNTGSVVCRYIFLTYCSCNELQQLWYIYTSSKVKHHSLRSYFFLAWLWMGIKLSKGAKVRN